MSVVTDHIRALNSPASSLSNTSPPHSSCSALNSKKMSPSVESSSKATNTDLHWDSALLTPCAGSGNVDQELTSLSWLQNLSLMSRHLNTLNSVAKLKTVENLGNTSTNNKSSHLSETNAQQSPPTPPASPLPLLNPLLTIPNPVPTPASFTVVCSPASDLSRPNAISKSTAPPKKEKSSYVTKNQDAYQPPRRKKNQTVKQIIIKPDPDEPEKPKKKSKKKKVKDLQESVILPVQVKKPFTPSPPPPPPSPPPPPPPSPPKPEINYKLDGSVKPPFSYATLICMAMKANDNKMTLSAIYKWIKENFLYYQLTEPSWQNSIRHNLSLNKCFLKLARAKDEPGKGGFWCLDPIFAATLQDGVFKKRRPTSSNQVNGQQSTSTSVSVTKPRSKKRAKKTLNDNDCKPGMTEEESRHQQAVSSEAEIIVEAIPDSEVELDSHPHYHYFQPDLSEISVAVSGIECDSERIARQAISIDPQLGALQQQCLLSQQQQSQLGQLNLPANQYYQIVSDPSHLAHSHSALAIHPHSATGHMTAIPSSSGYQGAAGTTHLIQTYGTYNTSCVLQQQQQHVHQQLQLQSHIQATASTTGAGHLSSCSESPSDIHMAAPCQTGPDGQSVDMCWNAILTDADLELVDGAYLLQETYF